jgi:Fe-S oxidoreductase
MSVAMEEFREVLSWDKCIECGECLANCRYIKFSRHEAIDEIKKINKGLHEKSRAVEKCMSCYACNAFCPKGAHPYERIQYAWNARYEREGLPARASYLMPGRLPNFRQSLKYTERETALHEKWASVEPPAKTCLYPGCNLLAMPLLAEGAIFEKLPVWGRWDLCCGEMFFRMGMLESVKKTAKDLTEFYHGKDIEELVFVCPAGYNMFSNVLPDQFGAKFDFKKTYFTDWFIMRIEDGTFNIKKKLSGKVVMHDSCHARVLGAGFMESQRKLLKMLGLEVVETEQSHEHGLCCGVAAGCNRYSLIDLARCGLKGLIALDKTDADEAALYCTGCLLTLGIFRLVNPFGKRLRHVVEYSRDALGEKAIRTNTKKAVQMALGIGINSLPKYIDPRRFKLGE